MDDLVHDRLRELGLISFTVTVFSITDNIHNHISEIKVKANKVLMIK